MGHDPVWVYSPDEDIWIANNYLNIFFVYKGTSWITHFINIVSDKNNPVDDNGTLVLELRHNRNDAPYYGSP